MRWKLSRNKRSFETVSCGRARVGFFLCGIVLALGVDRNEAREPVSANEMAARRTRIEKMSASDRKRLNQNLSRFLSLPLAEKNELIELHDELDRDPSLLATKQQFEKWLNQLSPWQRQEVVRQTSIDGKLAVVEAILQEQERQREESRQLQERVEEIWAKHWDAKPPRTFRMPTDALDRILAFLEKQLPEDKRPSTDLSKSSRRAAVLMAVLDYFADRGDVRQEPVPLAIYEQLKRKLSESRSDPPPPLFRDNDKDVSRNVTRLLAMNVLFIGFEEILSERPRPKSHEELLEFVDRFGPKYRQEFEKTSKRSRSEAFEKLSRTFTDLYFEQKAPEFRRESERLRERMRSLGLFRDWPSRRGGGRGPGGGSEREGRGPGGSERRPDGPEHEGLGPVGPERNGRGPMFGRDGERRPEDNRGRRPPRVDR